MRTRSGRLRRIQAVCLIDQRRCIARNAISSTETMPRAATGTCGRVRSFAKGDEFRKRGRQRSRAGCLAARALQSAYARVVHRPADRCAAVLELHSSRYPRTARRLPVAWSADRRHQRDAAPGGDTRRACRDRGGRWPCAIVTDSEFDELALQLLSPGYEAAMLWLPTGNWIS